MIFSTNLFAEEDPVDIWDLEKKNESISFDKNNLIKKIKFFFDKKNYSVELEELKKLSKAHNLSILEYSLKWIFENKSVQFAITGIKNTKQAEENISALSSS